MLGSAQRKRQRLGWDPRECCGVGGIAPRRSLRWCLVLSRVASLKTNKGEDADAGKPEMGKSVVIKESERFREGDRESARQRIRERNSMPCAQQ